MSHQMNLTDNQWYNFICGMQAGMRLKDLTVPAYDTNVTLTPIPVGGYGRIGIAIPQVLYNGTDTIGMVPVFTHDVDINYSGFSCRITWNNNRLNITGLTGGDFGAIGTDVKYSLENGVCTVRGMRDSNIEFTEPIILFYLNIKIIDTNIDKDNPIPINLVSGSGYDPNYTTLLKYVKNINDGKYYLYYITPITNVSGAIVSEKEPIGNSIGDSNIIAAPGSPSGIFVGTAYTPPGERGVVPIVANSNINDNFPYNGIHTIVVVEDKSVLFNYINVASAGGWVLNTNKYINDDGLMVLDITGTRGNKAIDSVTVGYIDYEISNKDSSYIIPLKNILSQLIG